MSPCFGWYLTKTKKKKKEERKVYFSYGGLLNLTHLKIEMDFFVRIAGFQVAKRKKKIEVMGDW